MCIRDRSCRQINRNAFLLDHLFCLCNILVSGTENFINLRYALCSVCHSCNSLGASCLEYFSNSDKLSCIKNQWTDFSVLSGRCTDNYFFTSGNLCWNSKHKQG